MPQTIKHTKQIHNNNPSMWPKGQQHIHPIKLLIVTSNNIVIWMHITTASNTSVNNTGISFQMPISFREMSLHNWPIRTPRLSCKLFKSSFSSLWDLLNSLVWYFQATSVMWVTARWVAFKDSTWRVAFRSVSTRARAKNEYWLTKGIIWMSKNCSMLINKLISRTTMVECFQSQKHRIRVEHKIQTMPCLMECTAEPRIQSSTRLSRYR